MLLSVFVCDLKAVRGEPIANCGLCDGLLGGRLGVSEDTVSGSVSKRPDE